MLESDDIESNVKVIDFGTSTIFKSAEKLREILGTVWIFVTKSANNIVNRRIILRLKYSEETIQKSVTSGAVES